MRNLIVPAIAGVLLLLGACTRHHVTADTTHRVEIAPIHVTVDINLKVQRALDDALSFQGDMDDIFTEEELEMFK
ncbi:MAG: hypothetical protein ACLFP9_01130 [Desulfonatronovibrio sp.]